MLNNNWENRWIYSLAWIKIQSVSSKFEHSSPNSFLMTITVTLSALPYTHRCLAVSSAEIFFLFPLLRTLSRRTSITNFFIRVRKCWIFIRPNIDTEVYVLATEANNWKRLQFLVHKVIFKDFLPKPWRIIIAIHLYLNECHHLDCYYRPDISTLLPCSFLQRPTEGVGKIQPKHEGYSI